MEQQIDFTQLSPEQKEALRAQFLAEEKANEDKKAREMDTYKDLVKKTTGEQIIALKEVNTMLSLAKAQVFGSFASIIEMKQELYGIKSGQQSHTFSDDDGNWVKLGWRTIDDYDDTFDMGLGFVKEYLHSLSAADREQESDAVELIGILLRQNAKGSLKLSRVMELKQFAVKKQNPTLMKGIDIIEKSYNPKRTKIFVEAGYTNDKTEKVAIELSITSVDFPDGFTPNFEVFK